MAMAAGLSQRGRQAPAALWLLGAVLQYETFMFSEGFPRMLVATVAEPSMAHRLILML
jgi:hypothetical protein